MGLEKEKAETCVFMDEEVFHSTIEPILKKKKEKARAPLSDRDPRNANAHLKVRQSQRCRNALINPIYPVEHEKRRARARYQRCWAVFLFL